MAACDTSTTPDLDTVLAFQPDTTSVIVGETITLSPQVVSLAGAPAGTALSSDDLIWTSHNPSVATVQNGVVTGVAPGTTFIAVRHGDLVAHVRVIVRTQPPVPTALHVLWPNVALVTGETFLSGAAVLDQYGHPYVTPPAGFEITWTTADASVAAATGETITAVGPGETTLTAQAGTLTPVQVQVRVEATGLSGHMQFTYSGERTGSFYLSNVFASTDDEIAWAVTFWDAGYASHDVVANLPKAGGMWDYLYFWSYAFAEEPAAGTTGAIATDGSEFRLNWDRAAATVQAQYFATAGGEVTLTSVTADRMRGTFRMPAATSAGGTITLVGSFDIPRL